MKVLILFGFLFFVSCKSTITSNYRDDFRGLDEKDKIAFLKKNNAFSEDKSVLLLTQGYKGEKIIAKQLSKNVYTDYPITNLSTKMADFFSFSNQDDLVIFDNFSKKEVIIPSQKAKKYKFIYFKKEYKNKESNYLITYSNTLRPLE